jgi:membrane-associated protein
MDILQIMLHLNQHLGTIIAQHGTLAYAVLFAIIFCEMGLLPLFFLPGDPLLFISGAFCATGALNVWILIPLLFAATVLGSSLNYWIGREVVRRFGSAVFSQKHKWLDQDALEKTRAFYEKYGRITLILSSFIAVVRTFAPFIGGVSGMALNKFLVSMVTGAAVWVVSLVVSGYFFGNIPLVRDHISGIVLAGLALGLGSLAISGLVKGRKAKADKRT